MMRFWDIAAELKDLRAEQKLVGDQWEELFQDMLEMETGDWLDWAFGGKHQTEVRKAWEAKNPRFRLTRRGVEVKCKHCHAVTNVVASRYDKLLCMIDPCPNRIPHAPEK